MLIGLGLLALALLFGSPQNDLLLPQIGKYAKKEIADKDRRNLVIIEINAVKQIQKEYEKSTKKNIKSLEKLVNKHASTKAEYDALIDSLVEYEKKVNEIYIPHRVVVQNALTQEEWENILIDAKKDVKKGQKSTQKKLKSFQKILEKNKKNILKKIDKEQVKVISERLDRFNKMAYKYGENILTFDPNEEASLLNKNATDEELLKIIDNNINLWVDLLNAFTTLNVELAKVVPANEWKSMAKELNKLY